MNRPNFFDRWRFFRPLGVLLLILSLGASGCVTSLGYIPEYVKTDGQMATYVQARKWATDVMDGYDSRATANRQALYGGSILGALGVSALTGLTLSHTRGTALSAVPLAFGFLGGVAALYQHEDKAAIYSRASRSVKALILMSDDRLTRFEQDLVTKQSSEITGATKAFKDAGIAVTNAEAGVKEFTDNAVTARREANDPRFTDEALKDPKIAADKKAKQDKASAAEDLEKQALTKLKEAKSTEAAAQKSLDNANARWNNGNNTKANIEKSEAVCLQRDIGTVMSKVEEHILYLDPKKVADTLRAVGKSSTDVPKIPPVDYSDIDPDTTKSACP